MAHSFRRREVSSQATERSWLNATMLGAGAVIVICLAYLVSLMF